MSGGFSARSLSGLNIALIDFDPSHACASRQVQVLRALGYQVNAVAACSPDQAQPKAEATPSLSLPQLLSRVLGKRRLLQQADLIWARGLRAGLVADFARQMIRASQVPLLYECLGRPRPERPQAPWALPGEWAQRRMLSRIAMLALPSQHVWAQRFEASGAYRGPFEVHDNRLWLTPETQRARAHAPLPKDESAAPLVLGVFSPLLCQKSTQLLLDTANRMGRGLKLIFIGPPRDSLAASLAGAAKARCNVDWVPAPAEAAQMIALLQGCDLVWAEALPAAAQPRSLARQLHIAGWAGCPVVVPTNTPAAAHVRSHNLGYVLESFDSTRLAGLLGAISRPALAKKRLQILSHPAGLFAQEPAEIHALIAKSLSRSRSQSSPAQGLALGA